MGPNSGHRIHTACLQKLQAADPNWECPRCEDLRRRAAIGADDGVTYCAAIRGGFKASTKIQATVDASKAVVAKNEKIIVFSFYKAGLDCVEGALKEEGIECLRFDGDLPQRERSGVLEAFRAPSAASHSAHVLLMTVHSGGTGLNIACANHVYFMDRWLNPAWKSAGTPSSRCRVDGVRSTREFPHRFNPQVHSQAISRVHRIGQTEDCIATYADAVDTIDEAMAEVNKYKEGNAEVVLADGSAVGSPAAGALTFKELAGVLGRKLREIAERRGGGGSGSGGGHAPTPAAGGAWAPVWKSNFGRPTPSTRFPHRFAAGGFGGPAAMGGFGGGGGGFGGGGFGPGPGFGGGGGFGARRGGGDPFAAPAPAPHPFGPPGGGSPPPKKKPKLEPKRESVDVSREEKDAMIAQLVGMGYPTDKARRGLRRSGWDVSAAVERIENGGAEK